jgi:DNA-binding beta-propeller fold protein YncE
VATWNNYNGQTFNSPQGIAVVGSSPTTVYVVDSGNDVVDEFTANGTAVITPIRQFGYPGGGGNGNLNNPTGIAIGTGGVTVYVADMDDDLIQKFVSGSFVGQFSTPPESVSNVPGIMGIAVNSGGDVFTADYNNGYIEDYNSTSSPVTIISQWGGPSFDTNPFSPTGVALNSGGTTLYVADYDNNAVYAVAP